MDVSEIITDALKYPFQNIKALIVYAILAIIASLAIGGTIIGMASGVAYENALATGALGIVGIVIAIIILLLISGYELDLIKYGILRDSGVPGIEPVRQIFNAIKLIILNIVYFLIPVIILAILGLIFKNWLTNIIGIILLIVFALAQFMGECRLAKTDSLSSGLAIGEAIGDISKVGLLKILAVVIISAIIITIITVIITAITNANVTVGSILLGIFGIYIVFFTARIKGLLYSEI